MSDSQQWPLLFCMGFSDAQGKVFVECRYFHLWNQYRNCYKFTHLVTLQLTIAISFYKWSSNLNFYDSIDNPFTLNGKLLSGAKTNTCWGLNKTLHGEKSIYRKQFMGGNIWTGPYSCHCREILMYIRSILQTIIWKIQLTLTWVG